MMKSYSLFQMTERFRQSLIAGHLFYVEQAIERLLAQFTALEQPRNAEDFVSKYMIENAFRFDPEFHDEGDAYGEACERYQALIRLGMQTRLSIVAGMYHEWEKCFRKWITDEIRHWHFGEEVSKKIWNAKLEDLMELMEGLGWVVRDKAYFSKIYACHLVVNVYKHGKGKSFTQLKESYAEYLPDPFFRKGGEDLNSPLLDHTYLAVTEEQLQGFSDAIVAFWKDVPKDIFDDEGLVIPNWFGKAVLNDTQAVNSQQGDPEL